MSKHLGFAIYLTWCIGTGFLAAKYVPVGFKFSLGFLCGAIAVWFLQRYDL